MSIASTIFKVEATKEFISSDGALLSFRKGQLFFVLSINHEKETFFVSTQYAVPFARSSVNGEVPSAYFSRFEDYSSDEDSSSDPTLKRDASSGLALQRDPSSGSAKPTSFWAARRPMSAVAAVNEPVSFVYATYAGMLSNLDTYAVEVYRESSVHTVIRSSAQVTRLYLTLLSYIPINHMAQMQPLEDCAVSKRANIIELFLNTLIASLLEKDELKPRMSAQVCQTIGDFFVPDHNQPIRALQPRRDSGHEDASVAIKIARFATRLFGSRKASRSS